MFRKCIYATFLLVLVLSAVVYAGPYNEAPMLSELVAAGKLPPVEDRLPLEPLVVEPVESIGKYGGTAHAVHMRPESLEDGINLNPYEPMLRIAGDYRTFVSNLATGYEYRNDGKLALVSAQGS